MSTSESNNGDLVKLQIMYIVKLIHRPSKMLLTNIVNQHGHDECEIGSLFEKADSKDYTTSQNEQGLQERLVLQR